MKTPQKAYGLARFVWRRLRLVSGGCCDLDLYDRRGDKIGVGFLYRYEALVGIPERLPFTEISWLRTINNVQPDPLAEAVFLGPTAIPIGERVY
jgi:hypothetical protein